MKTLTAEEAQHHLFSLIECAALDNQQYRITSEKGAVILLPEETYDNLMVTLELLSTPGLMESIRKVQ